MISNKWIAAFSLVFIYATCIGGWFTVRRPSLTCDFEVDTCDWKADSSSTYIRWSRSRRGRSGANTPGPSTDHTTGSGYYMVMWTHRYATAVLSLRSPWIASSNETCLTFWYQMHGYDVGGLIVNRQEKSTRNTELFRIFGPVGNRWYKAFVDAGAGSQFKLEIQASYYDGHLGFGDIAIDDIALTYDGPCKPTASEVAQNEPRFDCDFEDGFCSWYSSGDQWDRVTVNGSTTSDRYALPPDRDFSSYANVPVSRDGSYGYSFLRSPTVSIGRKGGCLTFWYKLNDSNVHTFSLQKYDYGVSIGEKSERVFEVNGDQGEVWIHQHVTITSGYNLYLTFEVAYNRWGNDNNLMVAVDDVTLNHDGPCQKETPTSNANCDFEEGLCRWFLRSNKGEGDWARANASTPTNDTGPSHDHTTGNGFYIYLDGSSVNEATLHSPPLYGRSYGICLQFWYHMYGEDVNRLDLSLHQHSFGRRIMEPVQLLLSIEGEQANKWLQQNVSIRAGHGSAFHLVFKASRGYFSKGDIAIDDIQYSHTGLCETTETNTDANQTGSLHGSSSNSNVNITPTTSLPDTLTNTTSSLVSSTSTELVELPLPKITIEATTDLTYVGSRVVIVCSADVDVYYFIWYRNDHDQNYTRIMDEAILIFEEIQLADAGVYMCQVVTKDRLHTTSATVDIRVVLDDRPSPLLTADNQTDPALMGITIKLICGREVKRGIYNWTTDSPAFVSYSIPSNRFLVLDHTNPSHNGNYSCHIIKDGDSTSKSNTIRISVVPGKDCHSDSDCRGEEYIYKCSNRRCLCNVRSVLIGHECRKRPEPAVISTWPKYREYNFGETFYLVCNLDSVAPASMTYTFMRSGTVLPREESHAPYTLFKVSNASANDSGDYICRVVHNDVSSYLSRPVRVVIKDMINLSCDFTDGFCNWFHGTLPYSGNFTLEHDNGDADETNDMRAVPFIRHDPTGVNHAHRATLRTPTIDKTSESSCLTFWYRLHGTDVYSLAVWIYTYSSQWNEEAGQIVWTAIGDRSNVWFQHEVTIPKGDNFFIQFEAIGDVAIDDVVFSYRGACSG